MSARASSNRATALVSILALVAISACSSDKRTVLTIYSPHGKELLEYYEHGFEQAHPNVDVQWVDMGSQEVLDRLRAEKANPQADLWFGAPAEVFARAADDSLLLAYKPTWAAAVPAEAKDSVDRWYGTYLTPEVIAYNSDKVTDADAPKDWDELLAPKWKDKVVIRDPVASGTMRAIFGAIMSRSMRETGHPDSGYAWLRRLDGQTREYTLNPTILYQKLGRGEASITLYNMPDIATLQARTKIPVKYKFPTSGTPVLVDAIALVQGGAHAEIAKQFYEYVTTPEAIITAAEKFIRLPARTDIPDEKLPAWVREAHAQLKVMPVDQRLLADSLNAWMTYWDAHIRNQSHGR